MRNKNAVNNQAPVSMIFQFADPKQSENLTILFLIKHLSILPNLG